MMLAPAVLLAAAAYANLYVAVDRPGGLRAAASPRWPGRRRTISSTISARRAAASGNRVNGGATWEPVFEKQAVVRDRRGRDRSHRRARRLGRHGRGQSAQRRQLRRRPLQVDRRRQDVAARRACAGVWSISRIAIDPRDSRHVVVGAFGDPFKDSPDRGVYVTFDGGATWKKVALSQRRRAARATSRWIRSNPNVVYAGMWHFRRVPWTFTSGGPDGGLFKSTDGGRTWKKLTGQRACRADIPDASAWRSRRAVPSRVFALIEAKGGILWRSDDAGAHWTMTSSDTLVDQRPFYFTHIAVDPANPNHVYAVSEMLAESKDGGKKFTEIAKGVHVDYHAIWIDPTNPKRIIVGEDGGYALTTDLDALVVLAQPRDRPDLSRRALGRESVFRLRGVSGQRRILRPGELARQRRNSRPPLDRRRRRRRHVDRSRSGRPALRVGRS